MANEAVPMFAQGSVLGTPFICANATGIEAGTLVKLADPFTVSKVASIRDIVGGITLAEKIASDGVLTVPVARSGIWKVVASGNVGVGDPLVNADATNVVQSAIGTSAGLLSGNRIFGIALETATDTQTFLMELRPSFMFVA